jgi:hypothetical protein
MKTPNVVTGTTCIPVAHTFTTKSGKSVFVYALYDTESNNLITLAVWAQPRVTADDLRQVPVAALYLMYLEEKRK